MDGVDGVGRIKSDATMEWNVLGESCQMERVTEYESNSRPGKKKPSLIFAPLWPGYLLFFYRGTTCFKVLYSESDTKKSIFRVHSRRVSCTPCALKFFKFPPSHVEPQTGKKLNSSAYVSQVHLLIDI